VATVRLVDVKYFTQTIHRTVITLMEHGGALRNTENTVSSWNFNFQPFVHDTS
jgi:hypothetical protein